MKHDLGGRHVHLRQLTTYVTLVDVEERSVNDHLVYCSQTFRKMIKKFDKKDEESGKINIKYMLTIIESVLYK